jgi:hypothetical protein
VIKIVIERGGPTSLGIVDEASGKFNKEAIIRVRNATKILLQAVRKKYRQNRGASRPGETPGTETGELGKSLRRSARRKRDMVTGIVGSIAVFARRLELGGMDKRGIYIAPRPAWRPAMMEQRGAIDRALRGE